MLTLKKFIALVCIIWIQTNMIHATSQNNVAVSSPGLQLLPKAKFISKMEANKRIEFIVWLKLRDEEQLKQRIAEIYDPSTPYYQEFLTLDEFNTLHAPLRNIEEQVQQFFLNQGMEATIVNHSVRINASVQQIERTLHCTMNYYDYQNRKVYANAQAPTIHPDIAPYIAEIYGLNKLIRFQPAIQMLKQQNKILPSPFFLSWHSFIPTAQPTTTSLNGFSGANLKTTYKLGSIKRINNIPIDGTGQTIVILDTCGLNTAAQIISDANTYNSANGLALFSSNNFTIINPDESPFVNCATQTPTGWESEIALDIESAHTIAPGAKIVLVLSPLNADLGTTLADLINRLANQQFTLAGFSNAFIISNSWGTPEFGPTNFESILAFGASQGLSLNFSTGDCGDGTYNSQACLAVDSQNTVLYPSSSLYVTAVGGTSIFVDTQWQYAFEMGWGSYINSGFYFGGGGGISRFFGPVSWQSNISHFTAGGYGPISNFNKRALPDISMLGDPITGLIIYYDGSWSKVGGTSLSSPLFSGTLALINQSRSLLNKKPIGLAAPYLYLSNNPLLHAQALNIIAPPHRIISGTSNNPPGAPLSAFTLADFTFGWDSSLTITPEKQFWNDAVGTGSPNIPNFVSKIALL